MKEITIEYTKFKEMKDKMIKVLANLEDIREGSIDINETLQVMINDMIDTLKLTTGKIHGSLCFYRIIDKIVDMLAPKIVLLIYMLEFNLEDDGSNDPLDTNTIGKLSHVIY